MLSDAARIPPMDEGIPGVDDEMEAMDEGLTESRHERGTADTDDQNLQGFNVLMAEVAPGTEEPDNIRTGLARSIGNAATSAVQCYPSDYSTYQATAAASAYYYGECMLLYLSRHRVCPVMFFASRPNELWNNISRLHGFLA